MSQTYNIFDTQKTVKNIFTESHTGDVTFHHVKDNIDLLAGDVHLDKSQLTIDNRADKYMMLYQWFANKNDNISQYDYILIDTHPDFLLATENAIVVSDAILSPITPDSFGYHARYNIEPRFEELKDNAKDFVSGKTYVTTKLYFLGNMIEKNRIDSREFLEKVKDEQEYPCIAIIPDKILFKNSIKYKTAISDMEKSKSLYNRNREFFNDINKEFQKVTDIL